MQIDISMDYVDINGTRVMRPARISRSEWLAYWEKATIPSG